MKILLGYTIVLTASVISEEDRMSRQGVRPLTSSERQFLNYNITEFK